MNFINSIIMGLVQGLAEFLPISSSGHLAIMKHILHMNTDTGLLFDVLLHVGTLIAIFIAFWRDIKELIVEGFQLLGDLILNLLQLIKHIGTNNKVHKINYRKVISSPYRKFVLLVIISTIPTAVIGFIFQDAIELVSTTLIVPGLCLVLTSILLMISDRVKTGVKTESEASLKEAGFIGVAQGIATLPGLSRSGTTITACLLCGFDKGFAVKYSFIMSIPAVLGAVVLEMKDFSMDMVSQTDLLNYAAGTAVAGIVGYISIKTMLVIVRGKKFKGFAYYCFIIGLIAVISHFVL
jgi:undecaprenyl-diphosphatase